VTVEEYAAAQAAITAAMVSTVLRIARLFRLPALTPFDWENLLDLLFPTIEKARARSAELGRSFYDAQREEHHPELPRHNTFTAEYRREWLSEAMRPVQREFAKPGASESALARLALQASKEVENGGRRTIMRAVDTDRVVQGWARVATGRETCGFCLTMVSRGPEYLSAEGAGLDADDTTALNMWDAVQNALTDSEKATAERELADLMVKWHTGCDCKVVPVFNRADWPGRQEYLRAREIWKTYSRLVAKDPALQKPQNGNQNAPNDHEWSYNDAVIAAIRRALTGGEIEMSDYAIAA
jgi:hypothetical protein